MKIAICGSMAFSKQMLKAKESLERKGHIVLVPEFLEKFVKNPRWQDGLFETGEHREFKKKHDLIKKHYEKIKRSDAILVLNYDKKGVKNYVGGNTLLEIGFAYILGKSIYMINPPPEELSYCEEIVAMEPIVIDGNLDKIS
jgi:nucleoside 2-deoxyribosyltransferase